MLILALELVAAQSGIDITLSTYDSTSHEAKIQIKNLDDVDYHDIYLTIDTWEPVKIVNTLGAKSGAAIMKIIPPGERVLKVTTEEGVNIEKKLNFLKTITQIQEEIEETPVSGTATGSAAEKEAQRIQELREKQREFLEKSEQEKLVPEEEFEEEIIKPEEETAKPAEKPVQKPEKANKSLIILIILLFLIFVVYLIFKKRRK